MAGESKFEATLIKELERLFPGAIILKNDANYIQGFPDRLMLWKNTWAAFEVKATRFARHRPNQDYYIDLLNRMSYASFIYPGNEADVLYELQQALRTSRAARIFKCK